MVRVIDIVPAADTGDQGALVYAAIFEALKKNDAPVTVSFDGVNTATSSFVNVAFVQLLSTFSISDIKRRLRVVDSTRQINDMIRTRIEREALCAA